MLETYLFPLSNVRLRDSQQSTCETACDLMQKSTSAPDYSAFAHDCFSESVGYPQLIVGPVYCIYGNNTVSISMRYDITRLAE
jgi:hypothetical protein